jgi:two-component system phosphate regulon sensor histidine kinase PhoR
MSETAKRFLISLLLFLAGGAFVGWLYDHTAWGLLVAALAALAWQVRQLLSFERALRTGNFDQFRLGEGLWELLYSRFRFEQQRAARRKRQFQALLREVRKSTNAMPDGAVILDANNEIITANRAAKDLAGLKRKKDRGQRVDNILRDPGLVRLLHTDDAEMTLEIPSPVTDGNWLSCRVVPYGADQKLLLLRDVTDRIALNKMRRDFVANASHELRSPLTVISGYLDGLADDSDVPGSWEKPVQQMQAQAARMRQILGELLELSRLESAGPSRSKEAVDVAALLESARQAFQGHADVARIKVHAESASRLHGSTTEIETVIANLLSNAVRHTPPDGEITLTWRAGDNGADLVVTDTGEGIDAEHLPRLTERFFRVDKGRSRTDGGVGLGLAIVKHVLARHDGELFVSSVKGKGSEFRCHFPVGRLVAAEPTPLS